MNIIIRKAEITDIPQLIQLNDEFNGQGATYESMKKSLTNDNGEIVFVAAHNEIVIGFICGQTYESICYAHGYQCEITELFVCKEYRRAGIATKLIKRLEAEFIKLGGMEIILKTGDDNFKAQALYEGCDYERHDEVLYFKEI